jgi:hypothetical protein
MPACAAPYVGVCVVCLTSHSFGPGALYHVTRRTSEIKDAREIPRMRMLCEILASLHDALMYTGQADMVQSHRPRLRACVCVCLSVWGGCLSLCMCV